MGNRLLLEGVALVVAFVLGAFVGYRYADNACRAHAGKVLAGAVVAANDQTTKDDALAEKQAKERVIYRTQIRHLVAKGLSDATEKATPGCDRDDVSYGLLVSAVRAANGTTGDEPIVPTALPAAAGTADEAGPGHTGVGVRPGRVRVGVSAASQ